MRGNLAQNAIFAAKFEKRGEAARRIAKEGAKWGKDWEFGAKLGVFGGM
jgi:hypothetical protein